MRLLKQKIIILWVLMLFFSLQHTAVYGNEGHNISPEQWRQLTSDKAYNYVNDIESYKPPKAIEPGIIQKIADALFGFFGGGGGVALLWILLIVVVVFILWKLFSGNGSLIFSKGGKKKVESEDIQEEDISGTNWEALLQQAMNNNDLRLAVRYSYMWLLQLLQQRELIQYRIDKTNYEYASELNDSSYRQPFKQLSRQYEYTWYGHFAVSRQAYETYAALFNNMKKELGA